MPSFKVKMSLKQAEALAEKFIQELRGECKLSLYQLCGSIRRQEPIVGDIDIVVDLEGGLSGKLKKFIGFQSGGKQKATLIYGGQQINVVKADKGSWGATVMMMTGPATYNIAYRTRAKKFGMKLNEYGLFSADGIKKAGETEEGIYEALGKPYKAPALRGK